MTQRQWASQRPSQSQWASQSQRPRQSQRTSQSQWVSQSQSQSQRPSQSQWPSQSQRPSQSQCQWASQSQRSSSQRRSTSLNPLRKGPGRPANLQMLWGTLLPYKDLGPEGEQQEDDDCLEEEEDPQFLDADEILGGGMVLKSAYCRICVVTIDDQICNKKFDVTGRFPLQGPWWEVRVYVKRVGMIYYMRGYPSYFLRTEFTGKRRDVLSLFLKECNVPDEFVEKFIIWLPKNILLTFHNLEEVLQQFSAAMDPEGGGYNILTYVQRSCTGVNVLNALQFPMILEYLPILLPRLFRNLLSTEKRKSNDDRKEPNEADRKEPNEAAEADRISNHDLLANLEEMLKDSPWKLGFSRITYRELHLVRCEASLHAFHKCDALLPNIPELQMNALAVYNYLKEKCQENGDTYIEQETLTKALSQDMSVVQAWDALAFLKEERIVVCEKDRIFLANLYGYEKDISLCIKKLLSTNPWHMNVNVEQVLRTEQAKLMKPSVTDDTSEKIANLLPEIESQEPVFGTVDPQNSSAFQGISHESRPEDPAEMEVDLDQVQAAEMICSNPLTVISGKGGCGKTTVVSILFRHVLLKEREDVTEACRAFQEDLDMSAEWSTQPSQQPAQQPAQQPVEREFPSTLKVLLTAPTGKAASLLKKKTNLSSFTLHQITASYCHWHNSCKDKDKGEETPWKFSTVEALVVDEGSLVSVQILSSVLKLLCEHARLSKLVILGDVRQLPSIEPGNMLADVFGSAKDINWAIELRTNHRAESQLIVDNATRISEQRFAQFDAVVEIGTGSDIVMPSSENKFILVSLPSDGNDDDLQTAVRILLENGPGLQDDTTSQFIAFRRADCELINELCCLHYSGHHTRNFHNKVEFQCQDKVCCTKNAYVKDLIPKEKHETIAREPSSPNLESTPPSAEEKNSEKSDFKEDRLCNGEIFFIKGDVEKDRIRCLTISDLGERVYELDYKKLRQQCNIKHAWARTIHTFQGSEEGTIVYVVGTAGRQNWQHVYTAVTRGRQRVYIIAKEDELHKAVFNKCRPRKTRLRQRLKETLAERNGWSEATLSYPLGPKQENGAPFTPVILKQEKVITMFPCTQTCNANDPAPSTSGDQNDSLRTNGKVILAEMTDSECEAACLSPERTLLEDVTQAHLHPLILTDTALEKSDRPASFCSQQKPVNFGKTSKASTGIVFPHVGGTGDWNTGYTDDVNVRSNISGSAHFVDLNSSDIEALFQSPLGEDPSTGDNKVLTPNRKRAASDEEGAESPLKTGQDLLEDSPLGCTKFRRLSLKSTCQKQLFSIP